MNEIKIITNNALETKKLGLIMARFFKKGDVITLEGDLGSGKTTLAQGIAKGLHIDGVVNSPTFNIIKCYFNGSLPLYHIDAYRLEGIKQDLGWEEYFEGDGVSLIEWPKYIHYTLPKEYLSITIKPLSDNVREFTLKAYGSRYEELLKEVKKHEHTIID